MELSKPLTEDQYAQIEAFVRSPAYGAFKALMDSYRATTLNQLLTEKNPTKLYELQGRMTAVSAMEKLPEVVAQQIQNKRKAQIEKEKAQEARDEALRRRKRS